jgi:hypothetical protein
MEIETLTPETSDISRESLLAEAHKVDSQNVDLAEETPSTQTPEIVRSGEETVKPDTVQKEGTPSSEIKSELREVETAKGKRLQDVKTGKFVKKDGTPEPEDVKPDTAFEKAKKEEARQKNLLANFEADKQRERQEIAQQKQQLAQERALVQQQAAQQRPEATKDGFTARDYWQAAQEFKAAGDHDSALKAFEAFQEVRNFEAQAFAQGRQKLYEQNWQTQMEKAFADDPDTHPNTNSQLSQTITRLLGKYPEAFYMKDGFHRMVEISKEVMDAGSVSELREKLNQAEKELQHLQQATQPAKGGSHAPSGQRKFEEMDQKEMREHLIRASEQADSQGVLAA